MTGLYTEITSFLPYMNGKECRYSMDAFIDAIYKFEEEYPEYQLTQYGEILKKYGIEWGFESMDNADISNMDGNGVMALLMAAIRADRFCSGVLMEFQEKGCLEKWVRRLAEIEAC
jgi:hypothetical protein